VFTLVTLYPHWITFLLERERERERKREKEKER
jgi:hypothetical protein